MAEILESFDMCSVHEVGTDWRDVGVNHGMNRAKSYLSIRDGATILVRIYSADDPKIITFLKWARVMIGDKHIQYRDDEIIKTPPAAPQ